ncbi:MAG: Ig-like domain-containing protein [Propionibacteriaceae bacterium]|jgi:hypothetical protein|nr:Ig-like domain-containing protein [Propionibacteriaceae bacterium]
MKKALAMAAAAALAASLLVSSPATNAQAAAATKVTISLPKGVTEVKGGTAITITVKAGSKKATGKVTLYDSKKKIGTATLKSGKATIKLPSKFAGGTHKLVAKFAGNSKFKKASASKTVTAMSSGLTINKTNVDVYLYNYWSIKLTASYKGKTKVTYPWLHAFRGGLRTDGSSADALYSLTDGSLQMVNKTSYSKTVTWEWRPFLGWGTNEPTAGTSVYFDIAFSPFTLPSKATAVTRVHVNYKDNHLQVGTDIQPGTYTFKAPSENNIYCSININRGLPNADYRVYSTEVPGATVSVDVRPTDQTVVITGCLDPLT